jgi:hypothetical protein
MSDHPGQQIMILSKQTTQRVHMERFNIKKLSEVEGKERYRVESSNRFAALETWTLRGMLIKRGKILERIPILREQTLYTD